MLFLWKNAILGYISLWKWNSAKRWLLCTPQNIINHNFVKYPNSMVWKLDVYINITITYFCKPKTRYNFDILNLFWRKTQFWPIFQCRAYSPEKLCHNRICCPSNRSKQVQETHTAYIADTQYTRQSLNEKQHTCTSQTVSRVACRWEGESVNHGRGNCYTKDKHTTHLVASIHWIVPQAHC